MPTGISQSTGGLPTKFLRPKTYYQQRKGQLELERSSFLPHYRELAQFIRPRLGRFEVTDRNRGDKRYQKIINSAASQAHKIAKSGMLAGTMSPARPWFALETTDPEMMDNEQVKIYLRDVETLMRRIFNESNFYGMASVFLGELLLFGTASMSHVDDFANVARFYTHTAGSYMIDMNDRLSVDTLYREFEYTVKQIVDQWGLDNASQFVRDNYDRGNYATWAPVCHALEPNELYKPDSPLGVDKAFKSVYYEPTDGRGVDRDKLLSVAGFDEFPAHVARWDITGEDIYGTDCPGMTALGDVKGLQIAERRKGQAVDKMVAPLLHGPPGLRNAPPQTMPNGTTIYDSDGSHVLKPVYQVNPQVGELRLDMDSIEQRINQAFFVDMFLAISQIEGIQPRNELDLTQRNEERLLQLGPVLEHIQSELLGPLIDRTYNQCVRADILPEAPEVLRDQPLKIKYVSTLAMAQKAVAVQNLERVVNFTAGVSEIWPTAPQKIDIHQVIGQYANAIGVDPSIVVDQDTIDLTQERNEKLQEAEAVLGEQQATADIANTAAQAEKTQNEIE